MPLTRVAQVGPRPAASRADRLLADALAGFSRRRIQAFLEEGRIRINGRRVRKGDVVPAEPELTIEIELPAEDELPAELEPAITVLYEDDACVALDKPPLRPGHALRSGERGTVANFLAARFPECLFASERALDGGLVHRLDTETSGVLLAARSHEAWLALRAQFRERSVRKRYLALVAGLLSQAGTIERAIEADPKSHRRVRVLAPGKGSERAREAVTRYEVVSCYEAHTLLAVEIDTGFRHQIRAHLGAIGHPIVGDRVYAARNAPPLSAPRHLLHASAIEIVSPATGRRVMVESPLPQDFSAVLKTLGTLT
jgi:23S rRNA pseudouridine1911/1915/1917 synthase